MIVEMRTYTLAPGGLAEYLRKYNESARELQTRILGNLLGVYRSEIGELNQLVFLWGFETFDELTKRRSELMADTAFAEFRKTVRHLLVKQENRLLAPA